MNSVSNIKKYSLLRCGTHCHCYNVLWKLYLKKFEDRSKEKEIYIYKLKQRECENYKYFIISEFIKLFKS